MFVYYRNRSTGKIEGKYQNCDTNSKKFRNKLVYERFESLKNLPLDVKRRAVPEPVSPTTVLKSPDGTAWNISVDNEGHITAGKRLG